jgi:drug/metabolite transporter (DMT)-like permease
MDLVAIGITLVAAMLLGVGWVLQQHAAEQAPQAYFLRLRLISDLLHRPRWLLGLAVMISGQLLSAWSVGHLDLSLYEPLLATSLIFALALAVPLSHQRLRGTELLGAVILGGGVAALSLARSPGTPSASFGSFSDWPAAAGIAVVAYCFIHAGHLRSGQARATLTGVGTGLVFGISDALTRRTVQILDAHSFMGMLTSWPPYCLLAAALIGMWLMQNSFSAAPLHASLPGITAAEPVSGILLGVVVFGDVIRISPGMLAVQAAGIAALVVGVIMVARAPVLGQLRPGSAKPVHGGLISRPDRSGPPEAASSSAAQPMPVPPVPLPPMPIPPAPPRPAVSVPPRSAGPDPSGAASLRPAAGGARSVPAG